MQGYQNQKKPQEQDWEGTLKKIKHHFKITNLHKYIMYIYIKVTSKTHVQRSYTYVALLCGSGV